MDALFFTQDLVAANPGALPLARGDKGELDTWALAQAFLTVQVRLAGQYHKLLTKVAEHYRRLYLQPCKNAALSLSLCDRESTVCAYCAVHA